jgi:hypothetical protein
VKRHGAATAEDYERWEEAEVARSVNTADAHRQDSGPALVAATLTRGSSSPGVNEPGRRGEDDVNIVPAVAATLKDSGVGGGPGHARTGGSRSNDAEATYVADTLRSHGRPRYEGGVVPEGLDGSACAHDPLPDGRRYAACGDGVASPVAHFIGLRMLAVMRGSDPRRP